MFFSSRSEPTDEAGKEESDRSKERRLKCLDIRHLDSPNQPTNFNFPKRCDKNEKFSRAFQASWFNEFPWLHYDEKDDTSFCFTCLKAIENGAISEGSLSQSDAFTKSGFSNWKKAMERNKGFKAHQNTNSHREAVARYIIHKPSDVGSVDDLLNSCKKVQMTENRKMLLKILSNIRFLGRQSLPFRGSWDTSTKSEENSNFHNLLKLRSEDDVALAEWMKRTGDRYTSPQIQNELIEVEALSLLRKISTKMQSKFFTIMGDESADVANEEQVVVCCRWVDDDLTVIEDFIGIKPVARCTADEIVKVLLDSMALMNLKIQDCRGQCYDGASVMSGHKSGVATQIKAMNPKALYTHCYGHALNLCVKDACSQVPCLSETFDTAAEIVKLVKKSPQRETLLKQLRSKSKNDSKSVHAFCVTRWTVRGEVLESILNNHGELMGLWEKALLITKETEMKARILGCQSQMTKFSFFFGCHLGAKILKQTDNLSVALQDSEMSALEGQELVDCVLKVLSADRDRFELFWELTQQMIKSKDVEEACLPRKRKAPQRYDPNEGHHHSTVKELYRQHYFQCYDYVTTAIKSRFDQPDYQMYAAMQNIILGAARGNDIKVIEAEMERIVLKDQKLSFSKLYKDDINMSSLKTQLELLPSAFSDVLPLNIHNILKKVRSMTSSKKKLISEVIVLLKLILVAPATNAESERIFSTMKRIKTYLRATMSHNRFNQLMILSVHKELLDDLDFVQIGNEFVGKNQRRRNMFGTFTQQDLATSFIQKVFRDRSTQT